MVRRNRRSPQPIDHRGAVLTLLLLDTGVLIAAERSRSSIENLIDDADDAALAAITVAELGVGVRLSEGARQRARASFLNDLMQTLPVLPYDVAVAQMHTELLVVTRQQCQPRGAHDLMIAATALATGRTIVTTDTRGFHGLPGLEVRHPE